MSAGMETTKRPSALERAVVNGVLVAAVVYALYPVLWVVSLALSGDHATEPHALPIPRAITLDNFRLVMGLGAGGRPWLFARQIANSLVVSLATALVAVAIATPTAYALARWNFVGKRTGQRTLLLTQMFPGVASAVPLYLILDTLHLLDTRTGLVLVYAATAVPFAIFQLRGAFLAIPVDLEEAAMVDGATRTQAFLKVALPAARPAVAVTSLFAFMSAWNEFILAATLLGRESAFTLPVVLQSYVGEYDTSWGAFAAGAILVSVPVMALFYVAQRQLISGLTSGGVKG
ncbi:Maltose/maltodextrin ABC transporter, permease protein MalG [Labilithrix luteola]|uniref:Maltose/maltodextrin transport system permease protein MalG n=1 Tax=Labilithrix luteola TaxID=1391654 RepID=A0A0K1PQW5_9BACT|nr:sugar ABC transporter permease [Labilithrix luteola]AKU95935.1 Maltose/maltodextrin ABC transporter, permease protein MalG [Labilithrix luteola]